MAQSIAGSMADDAAAQEGLILVCGRYEGVDERFIDEHVHAEWSIGDFVVSGGELPAMLVIDAIARQIPGTLGNAQSKLAESHLDGLLDYPHYTRPEKTGISAVPEVLLSGDHNRVDRYRRREALQRTFERRPDMLVQRTFSELDRTLLREYFAEKYPDE
jgi:tRNA (guanine37-N1)-methyltransferase